MGPGSYNLAEAVQMIGKSPSKNRRRSLDEGNLKIQELAAFKKSLLKGSLLISGDNTTNSLG